MSFRTAYGYSHSENRWRMCNIDECVSVPVVPASPGAPVRAGDVATILNAWIIDYNNHVEPIRSQVWGWSRDNDVATSNHLSGTAIDINAPWYPWGARTMPAERIAKVRARLKLFKGCIFWGADWDRADEMHYQIGYPEGDQRIADLARELNGGYLGIYGDPSTPAPAPIKEDDMAFTDDDRRLLQDIREQLCGQGQRTGGYKGWPQLNGRTFVDALAELLGKGK